MRLLVVDDDEELRSLLVRVLERDRHRVVAVDTVEGAREVLKGGGIDLIVLDLALPDASGIDLCRELGSARKPIPVLMLSAHAEIRERVRALDSGADDFVAKPFAVAELRARVRALGRRSGQYVAPENIVHGALRIDFRTRRATRDGTPLAFTAREWLILETLAARRGGLARRSELLERGWSEITDASGASLEVLIGRIRRKLGVDIIRTKRGEGYALEIPIGR